MDTDGVVFKIDPETGDISKVGDSGVVPDGPIPVSFYTVGAMADGSLFGIDYRQNLWRIDLKDGKAHLVGNTGLPVINSPHFGISLAGDEKYLYLTFEMSAPPPAAVLPKVYETSLLQIDPTTAKVTRIGRVPSFISGSTLVGGKLYAFTSDVTMDGDFVGAAETLEIDLKTAVAKKLVVPAPCLGFGFGGFAVPVAPMAMSAGRVSKVASMQSLVRCAVRK